MLLGFVALSIQLLEKVTNMGRPSTWTSEEIEQLVILASQGLTMTKAADTLDREYGSVRNKAERLKIKFNKKQPMKKVMKCLCCKQAFPYQGAFIRTCEPCKRQQTLNIFTEIVR